ncbi:GntR family transcriptional regulator [Aeromicrobium sp.]|uniref:GntR family transcriptional regulator n=1 Tax=Aeromicrobium sp. TaxID=1871063 RepID=UPI0025C0D56D|nr:GntR family transcriptional regulator [Aeromicrobium sp.]MCK5890332.1 GntR family transcriptional regulator [Aeromicrobium sp.]
MTEELGRVTTVDALVTSLRQRILSGAFPAGSKLQEVPLSESYGVGRYSLRGALRILTDEGLLRYEQNRGVFVPSLAREDVEDLFRFRAALEVEAARLAVQSNASLAAAEAMVGRLESMELDVPWAEATTADLGFHREVVRAAGSMRLLRAFTAMSSELQFALARSQELYIDPQRIGREHREILEALKSGDSQAAEAALRYHLEVASQELFDLFDPAT